MNAVEFQNCAVKIRDRRDLELLRLGAGVALVEERLLLLRNPDAVGEHLDADLDLQPCVKPPAALVDRLAAELRPARARVFISGPDDGATERGFRQREGLEL